MPILPCGYFGENKIIRKCCPEYSLWFVQPRSIQGSIFSIA